VLAEVALAVQGDQTGPHAAEAQLAVEALAGLHGPGRCDPTCLAVRHLDAQTGRRGGGEGPVMR
jgi:hypothetical protein